MAERSRETVVYMLTLWTILDQVLPQHSYYNFTSVFTGDINQARYSDTRWVAGPGRTWPAVVRGARTDHSSAVADSDPGQTGQTGPWLDI